MTTTAHETPRMVFDLVVMLYRAAWQASHGDELDEAHKEVFEQGMAGLESRFAEASARWLMHQAHEIIKAHGYVPPDPPEPDAPLDYYPAWRSIETAPRDGTRVLLGFAGRDQLDGHEIGSWDADKACWYDGVEERYKLYPTHWLPLPEPPEE